MAVDQVSSCRMELTCLCWTGAGGRRLGDPADALPDAALHQHQPRRVSGALPPLQSQPVADAQQHVQRRGESLTLSLSARRRRRRLPPSSFWLLALAFVCRPSCFLFYFFNYVHVADCLSLLLFRCLNADPFVSCLVSLSTYLCACLPACLESSSRSPSRRRVSSASPCFVPPHAVPATLGLFVFPFFSLVCHLVFFPPTKSCFCAPLLGFTWSILPSSDYKLANQKVFQGLPSFSVFNGKYELVMIQCFVRTTFEFTRDISSNQNWTRKVFWIAKRFFLFVRLQEGVNRWFRWSLVGFEMNCRPTEGLRLSRTAERPCWRTTSACRCSWNTWRSWPFRRRPEPAGNSSSSSSSSCAPAKERSRETYLCIFD